MYMYILTMFVYYALGVRNGNSTKYSAYFIVSVLPHVQREGGVKDRAALITFEGRVWLEEDIRVGMLCE